MEFDASTAEPVTATVEPQFDADSAQPVESSVEKSDANTGFSVPERMRNKALEIPDAEFSAASPLGRLKMILSHPWDKYVASVDEGFKGAEIPRVEADAGTGFEKRAGQVGAASTNIVTGVAGGAISPGAVLALAAPPSLIYSAPRFIAGGLEKLVGDPEKTQADFGALLDAKQRGFGGASEPVAETESKESFQETVERVVGGALELTGGVLGIKYGAKTGLRSEVAPKTPQQAIEAIKTEAAKIDEPQAKAALEAAAVKIEETAKKGVAFDPSTAQPVVGPEVTKLSSVTGGPEKLTEIQGALKSPDTVIQYSVWDRAMMPEGADRTAQVDLINPKDTQSMGGIASTNRGLLNELGVDAPPAPEWLPPGRYTLDQIKQAIADGPPSDAPLVGLGAASPAEFRPVEKFTTSLKNAVVDQERVARGEPALMEVAKKDLGAAWDEGMAKIDENQNLPDELIAELKASPRPVKDYETAVLLQRKIELQNEFNKASRNIEQGIGTPDSLAADRATKQRALDELIDLDLVGRTTGTEQGRGLNARKLMAAEDFSLTSMLTKRSAAKGDVKLTPEEIYSVEAQYKKIVEAQAEFDPLPAGQEKNLAEARLDQAKHEFNDVLERDRFDRLSGTQKLLERAGDTYDAAKNIMTTGELSFIGRQGLIQGVSHPIRTAKALPATFKALFADPITARAIDLQTLNDPAAPKAREAGVHLDEPGTRLAKKEEIVMSRWGDKTPVVRNFNQSGRVFLNKLRLDSFKALADMKPDATKAELSAFADYVNQSTGRGGLGQWGERNAVALSRTLFSPRFMTSRFQYLVGNSMWGGTKATRKILAKEYARTLIGLGAIYSLYEFGFAGDDKDGYQPVNFDPRSAMFGKMKIKDTTIDPLAGLSQAIVFGTRTGLTALDAAGFETGPQYMTNNGRLVDLRDENKRFTDPDWGKVARKFARSKLHPIPATTLNLMLGKDFNGQLVSFKSEAANFVAPMTYPDVYDALREQDIDDGTAIALLALLGAGINTYQEKEAKAKALKQPTNAPASLRK